jgi:glycosyltransferase involved in cell wall biosynthesis
MHVCCKGPDKGELAVEAEAIGSRVFQCRLGVTHLVFMRFLGKLLRDGRYDIVHNHLQTYSGLPVWLAHRFDVKVITSYHNTAFPPQESWLKLPIVSTMRSFYSQMSIAYAFRRSDMVTGCSRAVLDAVGSKYGPARNASRTLYYGVDLPDPATREQRVRFRQSFGWPEETPLIIHVGRFEDQKNHMGLVRIFKIVLKRIPAARLLLVGEGPLRDAVESEVGKNGLSHAVRLVGVRGDTPTLMTMCDLFLFPSLYEGFGLAALEANAAGLPVVGSDVPGLAEAVKNGETAILGNVHDVRAMSEAAVRLLTNVLEAREMGARGRSRAADLFSAKASADTLLNTYRECLEASRDSNAVVRR